MQFGEWPGPQGVKIMANQQWLALLIVIAIVAVIASVTYWHQLAAALKFLVGR